jgi:hypothetical protein
LTNIFEKPKKEGGELHMNDFLPKGYETLESERNYMEFAEGMNTFRILSPAIVGYEWFEDTGDGGRVPRRVRTAEEVPAAVRTAVNDWDQAKHFWAFTVFNYATQSIQVLKVKQKTIQRDIEAYTNNPKWGNPMGYDLTVEKVKTGSRKRDVVYHVIPEPPMPLDAEIAELARHIPVRLEALYDGEDPFAVTDREEEEAVQGEDSHREHTTYRRARAYS